MEIKKFLNKAAKYCARYETCIWDMKIKLKKWQIPEHFHNQIIDYLVKNKFIDEKRYVQSFVHDKFYINHWGKRKIYHYLKQKNLDDNYIILSLEQIDQGDYINTLKKIIINKKKQLSKEKTQIIKQKLLNFAINRGFEPELVHSIVDKIIKSDL